MRSLKKRRAPMPRTAAASSMRSGDRPAARRTALLEAIEGIDLVVDDPPDLQAEAVGTEVDGGDQVPWFVGIGWLAPAEPWILAPPTASAAAGISDRRNRQQCVQQNGNVTYLHVKSEDSGRSMPPNRPDPSSRDHFINRELSLLQFQRRVLAQAADPAMPLLERLRFLCIVSSNLDRFFEVRVAGVKEQMRLGSLDDDHDDGLAPAELHALISRKVHASSPSSTSCSTATSCPRWKEAWSSCAAAVDRRPARCGSGILHAR